jgi:hypothetical protein
MPRGYAADHPQSELLKFKSYLIMNEVPDKMVVSTDYFDHVIKVFQTMKPFNDYLNEY